MPPAAFLRNTEHAPLCVTAKGQTRLVPHQGGLWALGALRALGSTISNPAPGPASKTHTAAASRGSPSPGRGRDPRGIGQELLRRHSDDFETEPSSGIFEIF